jgi:hypothetical protein
MKLTTKQCAEIMQVSDREGKIGGDRGCRGESQNSAKGLYGQPPVSASKSLKKFIKFSAVCLGGRD